MGYKFEQLEVWNLSLEYVDAIYGLADKMPKLEEYNLKAQFIRAGTSIALNIAEGSQGQSDAEQARFLGMSIRSLIETVACLHLIRRRNYVLDTELIDNLYKNSEFLARKLQSFRRSLGWPSGRVREDAMGYFPETDPS